MRRRAKFFKSIIYKSIHLIKNRDPTTTPFPKKSYFPTQQYKTLNPSMIIYNPQTNPNDLMSPIKALT
jgi:hypothetical protein